MFQAKCWTLAAVTVLLLSLPTTARSEDKFKLEEPADDFRVYGVGIRLSVNGKVKFPENVTFPQALTAALSYRERRVLGAGSRAESFRSVREYQIAEADIDVGGEKTSSKLPEALKLVVAQGRLDGIELYSLNGLLTFDELSLIRSPADSLALIALLPSKEVEIGDTWTAPDWAFQMLVGLDAIVKGSLDCTLDSVEKGIAKIKVNGTLEGAAVGALTEVKLAGSMSYNLEGKFISEIDFVQKETRAIGPASPGLDLTARIRLLRQMGTSAGKLADPKIIETAANEPPDSARFLRFELPWNMSIQCGRYWYEYKDATVAKFRLIQDGNFIAQCDLGPVPPAKPGAHLAEQTYLTDVRRSLGERLRSMTNGEVIPSSDHKFVYKVSAEGMVKDNPVTWIFYLVADPSGRQASVMFTVDTKLVDKLTALDREIIDSLKFGPAPPARAANK